jgi:GAT domain-containing protein
MAPQQNTTRPSRSGTLPPPDELAARVAEAKTSATLLIQLIQSTPSNEIPSNDLIKEFSDRCQSASRSLQGFMQCKNPPPDDNTLLTLIETNDQLSVATSKYQRAILTGRKARGADNSPSPPLDGGISAVYMRQAPSPLAGQPEVGPVPEPPPLRTASSTRNGNIRYQYNPDEFQVQNPFADGQVASDSPDEISTISGGQNNKTDHGLFHRGTDTLFR